MFVAVGLRRAFVRPCGGSAAKQQSPRQRSAGGGEPGCVPPLDSRSSV